MGTRDPGGSDRVPDSSSRCAVLHLPRELARLESVKRIHDMLTASDTSLHRICRLAAQGLNHPAAAVVLLQGTSVVPLCAYGLEGEDLQAACDLSAWQQTVVSNKVLTTPYPTAAPDPENRTIKPVGRFKSVMAAPLRAPNGMAVGALGVLDTQERNIGLQDEMQLRDFRDTADEIIRLRGEQLHDVNTGLWTESHFAELLQREWTPTYVHLRPVTLIRIRLHGPAEDDHLRLAARFLGDTFRRSSDVIARAGRQDFLALLPETHAQGAMILGNWLGYSLEEALSKAGLSAHIVAAVADSDEALAMGPENLLWAANDAMAAVAHEMGSRCVTRTL